MKKTLVILLCLVAGGCANPTVGYYKDIYGASSNTLPSFSGNQYQEQKKAFLNGLKEVNSTKKLSMDSANFTDCKLSEDLIMEISGFNQDKKAAEPVQDESDDVTISGISAAAKSAAGTKNAQVYNWKRGSLRAPKEACESLREDPGSTAQYIVDYEYSIDTHVEISLNGEVHARDQSDIYSIERYVSNTGGVEVSETIVVQNVISDRFNGLSGATAKRWLGIGKPSYRYSYRNADESILMASPAATPSFYKTYVSQYFPGGKEKVVEYIGQVKYSTTRKLNGKPHGLHEIHSREYAFVSRRTCFEYGHTVEKTTCDDY